MVAFKETEIQFAINYTADSVTKHICDWLSLHLSVLCVYHNEIIYLRMKDRWLHNARLTFSNPTLCPHSVCICFVWISEQTAIISAYNINW